MRNTLREERWGLKERELSKSSGETERDRVLEKDSERLASTALLFLKHAT